MTTAPSVTIVVVPRERFSPTRYAFETLLRNTELPYDLVLVDGNSPPPIARYLREQADKRGFRLIRTDRLLSPNAARNLGVADVRTDYVVFIDNDCLVTPGWLPKLLGCARETGAWIVAPLYLEGRPEDRIIHMACGTASITERDGVRSFKSDHTHAHRRASEIEVDLVRGDTELFEFHCVLVDRRALGKLLPLDEELLSNHEHEDLALQVREAGGRIVFEPSVEVTYLFGKVEPFDTEFIRVRWGEDWVRKSTRHFARKWRLHDGWGASSIAWCNEHRERLLRPPPSPIRRLRRSLGRRVRALLS